MNIRVAYRNARLEYGRKTLIQKIATAVFYPLAVLWLIVICYQTFIDIGWIK